MDIDIFVHQIKDFLWNDFFIMLIFVIAIVYSIILGFPQLTKFKEMFYSFLPEKNGEKGLTPFQAFSTTVGARVGVGNIAGVATAIFAGGPGALLWIWIFGIFSGSIAFVEAVLGCAYRDKYNDEYLGGPAWYISNGLHMPKLAKFFSILVIVSIGLLMPGVQMDSIVLSVCEVVPVEEYIICLLFTFLAAIVIWGGIKRIGQFCEIISPVMCFAYLLLGIIIIVVNINNISTVFHNIFYYAFTKEAFMGGFIWAAIKWGVERGIFSTDVGYGPGATYSSLANSSHPVKQAFSQVLSILISTILICSVSGLCILVTNSYNIVSPETNEVIFSGTSSDAGILWSSQAFNTILPFNIGGILVALFVVFFAITSIMGYYCQIEVNYKFIVNFKERKFSIYFVKALFLAGIIFGGLAASSTVWTVMDIGMALMAWINIIIIMFFVPKVRKIYKDYLQQKKSGVSTPKFDPSKYDIADKTKSWNL